MYRRLIKAMALSSAVAAAFLSMSAQAQPPVPSLANTPLPHETESQTPKEDSLPARVERQAPARERQSQSPGQKRSQGKTGGKFSSDQDFNEDAGVGEEGRGRFEGEFFVRQTGNTLQHLGRDCLRDGNYLKAMLVMQKAIKLSPNDVENYVMYAEAMQGVLERQEDKDPELFNKCVGVWLQVLRSEVGEEKGLSYKGLSLDNGLYGDEDTVFKAKRQLRKLTGYVPKPWETDNKYLTRVLRGAKTSVTAEIKLKTENAAAQAAPAAKP